MNLSARMKGKRYLLIGLTIGAVCGWALGFLRFPYLEKNGSFLLGFVTALAFASFVLMVFAGSNRYFLSGLTGKKTGTWDFTSTRKPFLIWVILVGLLVLGSIAGGISIYRQNAFFKLRLQTQDKKVAEMNAWVASLKKNDLEPVMRSMLEEVGEEVKRHPSRTLTDSTIVRLATLSSFFKPYQYPEGESLSVKAYSPKRGQLLQALMLMHIDTGSFARIKEQVLFTAADLQGADLKGVDLNGIHLTEANLKDADLSGANLQGADLRGANLWGANLNRSNLSNANLKGADLSWAQLNESTLQSAILNGTNFQNAQLRKADLFKASFQSAQAVGALFNEAKLISANVVGTNLSKANLNQANFSYTDMRRVNLSEANLIDLKLNNALVDKNWLEEIKEWRPIGIMGLQKEYTFVNDTFNKWNDPLYRLRKTD